MTTSESTVQIPRSPRLPFRLERAELLKLRKSRGVWIPTVILTVGAIAIMYTAVELFHVSNSTKYGPAGGTINFGHALLLMGQIAGMIAAALGYLTPVQGALLQEVIDVAVILNALRVLRDKA